MKEIENIKNLPFFTYLLFLITSLSFFLQPLIIRPYGIPVSFSLIIILNLLMIINLKNLNLKEIIYLTFISSFLLIVDIITPPGEYRGLFL